MLFYFDIHHHHNRYGSVLYSISSSNNWPPMPAPYISLPICSAESSGLVSSPFTLYLCTWPQCGQKSDFGFHSSVCAILHQLWQVWHEKWNNLSVEYVIYSRGSATGEYCLFKWSRNCSWPPIWSPEA